MNRSFRRGMLLGTMGPLALIGGIVCWIYRHTGKVPFPIRRIDEGEVAIRLVDTDEVPAYWQQWQEELQPLLDRLNALRDEIRARGACE